jgi:hypothetical protein
VALQVTDFGQWAEATSAPSIGSAFGSAFSFSGLYRFTTADGGTILGVGSSGTSQYIALAMLATGQGFLECSGGGTADAFATGNFSTGVWHSLVGVQSSSTSRVFYGDGVAGTGNTTSANPTSAQLDRTTIGALVSNGSHLSTANGDIAECAIWDVDLTAEEAAMLAAHVCPLLVRPSRLVFYCPAQGTPSAEIDRVAGRVLTWGGFSATVPAVAPHPAVLMPPTGPVVALDAGVVSAVVSVGDTVAVSDAVTGGVALARAVGDPVVVGDVVARGGVAQARALGDPVVVADAVARGGLTAGRGLGDVVGSSDAVSRGGVSSARVLSEAVGVSDGVDRLLGAVRAVAELVLVTDGVVGRSTEARAVGDVVAASDAAPGRVLGLMRLVGDPVVVTDAVSRAAQGMSRALGDVVVVVDAVSWPYVAPGDVLQLEVRVELTAALDTVVSVTPVIAAGVEVTA